MHKFRNISLWIMYTLSVFGFLRLQSLFGFHFLENEFNEYFELIFSAAVAIGGVADHNWKRK